MNDQSLKSWREFLCIIVFKGMNIKVVGIVFLMLGAAFCAKGGKGGGGGGGGDGGDTGGCDNAPRSNKRVYSLEQHMYEDDTANW